MYQSLLVEMSRRLDATKAMLLLMAFDHYPMYCVLLNFDTYNIYNLIAYWGKTDYLRTYNGYEDSIDSETARQDLNSKVTKTGFQCQT